MPKRFKEKKMHCMAIAGSASQRQMLGAVLRDLGFANVAVVGDIKACLGMVEAEEIGWIISPMVDANDLSVLQLLEVVNSQANLRTIKVSILRDDNDELLPKAFSLGAFSCHKFSMNREACHEDLTKLFGILDRHEHDFAKVAADYLRDYLHEAKLYGEMRSLFAGLLQVYPGNPAYLLELAHANLALGKDDIGRILLQQAKMSGTLPAERIRAVCQEFFSTDEPPEESQQFLAEHLGFRSCLVVDPTPESLTAIKKTLEQLGFHNVICHADPVSALKWLRQNKKIDLIISEWKLPQLPGPVFLYKLRNKLGLDIPLLIINEAIEEKEIPLLNELGASRILRKPIDPQLMSRDIIWILQQHTNPTEPSVIRQKLRLASQRQDLIETKKLKQLYLSLPTLLEGDKLLIEAQVALDTGCFLHAKKHALAAMKKGGDFKESMEILGKSLMKLREFDAALRCLANVSIIAPLNVSHLCDIAECQLEKGDTAAFDKSLHQAQDLDEDASRVIETEAKGAIKNGHTEAARKLLSRLKSLKEVMAFMNNRAVSLIRVGNYKEGFDLYQRTLDSLPHEQAELQTLIHYNLGLGFTRAQRYDEAIKELEKVETSKNRSRVLKAKSLKSRVVAAMSSGEPIILKADTPPSEKDEKAKLDLIRQVEKSMKQAGKVSRTDYCLINIYRTSVGNTRATEYLDKKVAFTARGKLVKDFHKGLVAKKEEGDNDNDNESSEEGELEGDKQVS